VKHDLVVDDELGEVERPEACSAVRAVGESAWRERGRSEGPDGLGALHAQAF